MSQVSLSEQRLLARPVLLYQTVKTSRKFHALDCDCTGRGDVSSTAETTVRGALALNYHPADCVAPEVRDALGTNATDGQYRETKAEL
jgi:hypothetical protein